MKTSFTTISLICLLVVFTGCNNDDDTTVVEFSVTSISPTSGTVGTEITINGTDFPSEASEVILTIGGTAATISSISSTRIVSTVPAGAVSGNITIETSDFTKNAPESFTVLSELVSATASNVPAPQTGGQGQPIGGPFTKFSFESGEVTTSDTEWDIAFRGTTIAINGGAVTGTDEEPARNGDAAVSIENGTFSSITSANGLSYSQDANGAFGIPTGSDNGWYNYNPATFIVSPIPGKILVFRTHDGKYAKIEILSYYRDAPAQPDAFMDESRFYTFNYVYNPNDGETSLAE